jgi:hypothetical protein
MSPWYNYYHLGLSWILSSLVYIIITPALAEPWTQIGVKNITLIGPQLTPDVTNVSRDGGYSVLINDNIVWLYDDTECMGYAGNQLSFVSNTAALSYPNQNISTVDDFGVVEVGTDRYGRKESAILANDTVGTGGWIPFMPDELQFNDNNKGRERVAICKSRRGKDQMVVSLHSWETQGLAHPRLQSARHRPSCTPLLFTWITSLKIHPRSTKRVG